MFKPILPALALLLGLLPACSVFDKDPEVVITVHSQGTDMDSPKTVFRRPVGGRNLIFKILPEFSTKSVAAFHPFNADDGTYGVALKLDFKGANALELVTRMRQGEILVSMVNGVVVDYVHMDKVVSDGIYTIWRGLPEELIAQLDKDYPRISELKSSSEFIEMTPSTGKEKKDSRRRAEKDAEEATKKESVDARHRARGEFDPELPKGEPVPLSEALKFSR